MSSQSVVAKVCVLSLCLIMAIDAMELSEILSSAETFPLDALVPNGGTDLVPVLGSGQLALGDSSLKTIASGLGYVALFLASGNSLPQLIHTFKSKSASGISLDSMLLRFSANSLKVFGVLFSSNQLLSTQITASFQLLNTVCLSIQACYYRGVFANMFRNNQDRDEEALTEIEQSEMDIVKQNSPLVSLQTIIFFLILITIPILVFFSSLFADKSAFASLELSSSSACYLSTIVFIAARIPQFLKNRREPDCKGLSPLPFMMMSVANFCNGTSVFLNWLSRVASLNPLFPVLINFMQPTLALMIGAYVPVMIDAAIATQVLSAPSSAAPGEAVSAPARMSAIKRAGNRIKQFLLKQVRGKKEVSTIEEPLLSN